MIRIKTLRTLPVRRCVVCLRSSSHKDRGLATVASPDVYDVVCIGGGPAGLSLLTALRVSITLSTSIDLFHNNYRVVEDYIAP